MKTISTHALRALLNEGPVALFDVRGDVEFEKGHIAGAMTAPLGSLSFRVAHTMNPESLVVVYSMDSGGPLAPEAANRLENLGLRNVRVYQDGLAGWELAGQSAVPSVQAKLHTQGPVKDVRPLLVDRENSYGGAFRSDRPLAVEGAGG